jgi:hypothetical protein
MSIDNHTGIEDTAKQHSLDFIRENLENIPKSMIEEDVVDKVVEDISLRDVYHYITQIKANQDLDLEDLRIRYVSVRDLEQFANICEYQQIHNVKLPSHEEQRIYFIESSDFATTLIPIQLDDGSLNIFMEPLDSSPELIREMFAELEDGERELARELRKEKVEFIKKNRKEELALKEP